ncbi:MAG: M14 family metallopeptidase [Vicinamibacterales bacterium]|nr:M14 family metallopeptidase [Vicinamibacterales bacterium]
MRLPRSIAALALLLVPALGAAQPRPVRAVLPPELPWSGRSEALARPASDPWVTPSEASGLTATPRYDETVEWLQKLVSATPDLRMASIGTSPEGRRLWMVIASRDRAFTPREARATGKPIVLAQAGIHAGEIDGKDAGLMLLRDMTVGGTARDVLDQVILLFVPVFNVDGHERFSPYTRINQRGPVEAGWRANARGLNLNRDYAKVDTEEMRAMIAAIDEWRPHLYLDLHVTDGADYQADITYGFNGPEHASPAIGRWLQEVASPAIDADLRAMGHHPSGLMQFVADGDPAKGVHGWWAEPRFSNGYGDLRHLPTILLENHSLKPYRQRVLGTRVFLESVLRLAARERASLLAAIEADASARRDPVVLEWGFDPARTRPIEIGAVSSDTRPSEVTGTEVLLWTGTPVTRTVPFRPMDVPGATVRRPAAYLVPPAWREVIDRLTVHGIRTETLTAPLTLEVEMYRLPEAKVTAAGFEGRVMVQPGTPVLERRRETFPALTVRVPTDQPLGDLAIALLEPHAPDAFFRWGFFLSVLQPTEYVETYIMAPTAERMLADDPALRAEFEKALSADAAFAANPRARLRWFYERTPYADTRVRLYPVAREPSRP